MTRLSRAVMNPMNLAVVLACALIPHAHAAGFTQQGPKLIGSGGVGNFGYEGYAVAVSADGNTTLVGSLLDDSGVGAAWVFVRSNGAWTQQGPKLVGTGAVGAAVQGGAVALSADGNTAIVAGYSDNGNVGAVWVFTRSGGTWTQQGPKLVGAGAVGPASQGSSVALSADGNTALVSGAGDNFSIGATWVFTRSGGTWTQQGPKLIGTGAVGAANQGSAVALSADGNTALVGGYADDGNVGAAWAFTRSGSTWTQQGLKLIGTGALGAAHQGWSVALSADGNTALLGGSYDNSTTGAAWVYTRSGGAWSQQGQKLVGTGGVGQTYQGFDVGLSGDGNTALLGGPGDNGSTGASWVFTRSGAAWSQLGQKLVGAGAAGASQQGFSVALSADGLTAAAGGPLDDDSFGATWIFARPVTGALHIRYMSNLTQGDSVINLTNTGENGASLFGPGYGGPAGNICVNVYAFSPDEQLISCCSCLVTPNGLMHVTANNDLVSNTLTGLRPNSIVVKLVSTGAGKNFTGNSCSNSAAQAGSDAFPLSGGMLAWGTTLHSASNNDPPEAGSVFGITETPFLPATLSSGELASMRNRCTNIIGNGSSFGICKSCRLGGLGGARQ